MTTGEEGTLSARHCLPDFLSNRFAAVCVRVREVSVCVCVCLCAPPLINPLVLDVIGESELMLRLVRPHLAAGDALLFDCRVLHFGLANGSPIAESGPEASITRAIVYINYHHEWFNDPKNWNNAEKLFPEC